MSSNTVDTKKPNSFEKLFANKKVTEFVESKSNDIFMVSSTETLENVTKVLSEKKFRSVPVVDYKDNKYKVLGLLDYMDICTHILDNAPSTKELKNDEKKATEEAKKILKSSTAYEVVNKSGINPFVPVSINGTYYDLLTKLTALHRVPVLDNDGNLLTTVSQTSFIKSVYASWDKLESEFEWKNRDKSIKDLGLGNLSITVRSVNKNDDVLTALEIIEKYAVSAIPVVDDDGKIISNFSAADLRGFFVDDLVNFTLTVEQYITKFSTLCPATISADESFTKVVEYFAKGYKDNKVHRLWVVNEESKPIGVVSMTDIIKFFRDYDE